MNEPILNSPVFLTSRTNLCR